MKDKIINLEDYKNDNLAFSCDCGSINFCLLKSGKIECSNCQEKIKGVWLSEE